MLRTTYKIIAAGSLFFASAHSQAIICMAKQFQLTSQTHYSATNCQYFSGSKALRVGQSGSLYNYDQYGDYNDQMYGHSYIYCPIVASGDAKDIVSADISVSDVNKKHDVVCQMGQSVNTTKGYAAYWGRKTQSTGYGEQTISANNAVSEHADMKNAFIACSLPPQDEKDKEASSMLAYSVESYPEY